MKTKKIYSLILILTTLIFAGSSISAKGQCKDDKKKFCADVKKGEGRVFQCLVEHYEELSPDCKKKIDKKKEKWQKFKEYCGADLDKFCPNVQPGKGRIRACLAKNKDQLSESCKTFLKEHKKDKKKKDKDESLETISEIENEISKEE
ncbi:MAG: hypothetical protein KatS3mg129_3002 [Leptospiraceae bacterium]|nr:MAG: hypothetical protein KatS3mg129_3002 [Leptospiraceae bacterium]